MHRFQTTPFPLITLPGGTFPSTSPHTEAETTTTPTSDTTSEKALINLKRIRIY